MSKASLSPSVHEAMIKRHMVSDDDDPILTALFEGVKLAREMASKAAQTTDAVLANKLETEAARHKKARAATFTLLERATTALDEAVTAAQKEIATIKTRLCGPPPAKDLITETRQRELRERMSMLPEERRKAIIIHAINSDDDLLVGAILNAKSWLSGLSDSEVLLCRHNWATKRYPADVERLDRLEKAMGDTHRAGQQAISFIDSLTDANLIAGAEASEKKASDALAAAKV